MAAPIVEQQKSQRNKAKDKERDNKKKEYRDEAFDGKGKKGKKQKQVAEVKRPQPKEEKKEEKKQAEEHKELFDFLKDSLDGKVKEVKVSTRRKDHPVCLSADGPLSIEMEKVLSKQPGSEGVKSDKVLELNVNHPVFAVLKAAQEAGDTEKLKKYSALHYAQAQLIEGLPVDDPAAYAEAVCSLMQ